MSEPTLYTVKEAAERLKVSPSLVYQWCEAQLLAHYRFGTKGRRGKIMIAPGDLETFMRQCRVEGGTKGPPEELRHIRLPS